MTDFYGSWVRFKGELMPKQYNLSTTKGLQRNDGIGDYFEGVDGSWTIIATEMKEPQHAELILLHELIEVMLIRLAGIPEPVIDAFDAYFEVKRKHGLAKPDDEPGDDPTAPYHEQHQAATRIERMMCEDGFKLSWDEYCQACNEVT